MRIKRILLSRRGEGYIDVVVAMLCSMMVLVLAINTFSLLKQRQDLDYFAKELLATAVTDGQIASNVSARYEELAADTGLRPEVAWEASYVDSSRKTVQLGDTIKITLTLHTKLVEFGERVSVPVTLTARHSAVSQRYWK